MSGRERDYSLPLSFPLCRFQGLRDCLALALLGLALAVPIGAADSSDPLAIPGTEIERQREAAFEFARAKLLSEEGAFEKALKAYDRALELDGSDPYSRIEVAKFHSYLAQISRSASKQLEYLESAAGYAGEARRLEPENLEILGSYAQVHLRLGEHQLEALEQAQEAYEELRTHTEGDLKVLTSLGQIYLWKQDGEQAVEVLEEAASYRPGHRMIQAMLLEALLKVERLLEAENVLEQLIEIEPTVARLSAASSRASERTGRSSSGGGGSGLGARRCERESAVEAVPGAGAPPLRRQRGGAGGD